MTVPLEIADHLADLVAKAQAVRPSVNAARLALSLLDLTSLNEDDTDERIDLLCHRAGTAAGSVAAVCVLPRFVDGVRRRLEGTGIRVATVVNYPEGRVNAAAARQQAASAVRDGADEVDVVFPYGAFLAGDRAAGAAIVSSCRAACGHDVALTVTLESGAFADASLLAEASRLAIHEGGDFIKTSTGRMAGGASLRAAAVMLEALLGAGQVGYRAGLKVLGGVDDTRTAATFMALAVAMLGRNWITPNTMRIGGGPLLDDLLAILGVNAAGPSTSPSY